MHTLVILHHVYKFQIPASHISAIFHILKLPAILKECRHRSRKGIKISAEFQLWSQQIISQLSRSGIGRYDFRNFLAYTSLVISFWLYEVTHIYLLQSIVILIYIEMNFLVIIFRVGILGIQVSLVSIAWITISSFDIIKIGFSHYDSARQFYRSSRHIKIIACININSCYQTLV